MNIQIDNGKIYSSPVDVTPDGYDAFCDRKVLCTSGYKAQGCGEKNVVCVKSGGRTKMKRQYKKRKSRKRTKRVR